MEAAEPELAAHAPPALSAWLEDRRPLGRDSCGPHARCLHLLTYTDDPRASIIGVARTVRFLCELWDLVVRVLGLTLAPPAKWGLGCSGTWVHRKLPQLHLLDSPVSLLLLPLLLLPKPPLVPSS